MYNNVIVIVAEWNWAPAFPPEPRKRAIVLLYFLLQ